jgi:hypothetical protein
VKIKSIPAVVIINLNTHACSLMFHLTHIFDWKIYINISIIKFISRIPTWIIFSWLSDFFFCRLKSNSMLKCSPSGGNDYFSKWRRWRYPIMKFCPFSRDFSFTMMLLKWQQKRVETIWYWIFASCLQSKNNNTLLSSRLISEQIFDWILRNWLNGTYIVYLQNNGKLRQFVAYFLFMGLLVLILL